jgi:hypothetical protein
MKQYKIVKKMCKLGMIYLKALGNAVRNPKYNTYFYTHFIPKSVGGQESWIAIHLSI